MSYDTPWDVYGAGNRQPNFLQKLYDFLGLDPHPCPEVIYWAADSRQLVIAQPERLVKEVLPRLFKHDKMSSFGRQLNIYGFARVFPGRQFKDAKGRVLDASVWAHPTLHRLSTAAEICNVKRRAAPKLFRTRRLANGQVVRSKAGPDVEKRFREVKEGLAVERRERGNWSNEVARSSLDRHAPPQGPINDGSGQWQRDWSAMDDRVPAQSSAPLHQPYSPWSRTPASLGAQIPLSAPPYTPFQGSRLSSITEGKVQDIRPPFWATSRSMDTNDAQYPSFGSTNDKYHDQARVDPQRPPGSVPDPERPIQSCPASIHASPILGHSTLSSSWASAFSPFPSCHYPHGHRDSIDSITSQLSSDSGYEFARTSLTEGDPSHLPMRIATPAAPYPFHLSTDDIASSDLASSYIAQSQSHPMRGTEVFDRGNDESSNWKHLSLPSPMEAYQPVSSFSSGYSSFPTSLATTAFPSPTMAHFAPPIQHSGSNVGIYQAPSNQQRRDTIDPRWISPLTSMWSTPAQSPKREASPVVPYNHHNQAHSLNQEQSQVPKSPPSLIHLINSGGEQNPMSLSLPTAASASSPASSSYYLHPLFTAHTNAHTTDSQSPAQVPVPAPARFQMQAHMPAQLPEDQVAQGSVIGWTTIDPFRRQSDSNAVVHTATSPFGTGGTQSYPPLTERRGLLMSAAANEPPT